MTSNSKSDKKEKYAHNRKRVYLEGITEKDYSEVRTDIHIYKYKLLNKYYYVTKELYHDLTIDDQVERQRKKRHKEVCIDSLCYEMQSDTLAPDEYYEKTEKSDDIDRLLKSCLGDVEYRIFSLIAHDIPFRKIGSEFGISHVAVSKKYKKIKEKIKTGYQKDTF